MGARILLGVWLTAVIILGFSLPMVAQPQQWYDLLTEASSPLTAGTGYGRMAEEVGYNYWARNIKISRSNTEVDGLTHYVVGETAVGHPYSGFISISDCANITLRDCFATGHKTYSTIGAAAKPFGRGSMSDAHVSALMFSYPIGILDNLRAIALYDWRNKGVYSFVGWQRTLDSWLFSATAFWNPDTPVSLGAPGGGAAGKGIQVMVVFNH